ncbi:hypothetical protein HC928_13280 [bacterium]|nr:hypothetical protein [bacterium]
MNIESIPAKKGKRGKYTFFICATMKNSRGTSCEARRISMKSLDQTVIENLLVHVLTIENLRPLAKNIAESLMERSSDAGTRIMALEDQLAEMQKSLENIMDAIEQMGYAKRLQQRFDERKREEEELLTEIMTLQALQVNPTEIAHISDEALEGWINYMRDAMTDEEDRAVARRIIERFVAKIVIKEGTGTLYYTFPFPNEVYMPSVRDLDLTRFSPNIRFLSNLPSDFSKQLFSPKAPVSNAS